VIYADVTSAGAQQQMEYHLKSCSGTNYYSNPAIVQSSSAPDYSSIPMATMSCYNVANHHMMPVSVQNMNSNNIVSEVSNETSQENSLVCAHDRGLVTDYFCFLVDQYEPCYFTEADRNSKGSKRENVQLGFGGLACRHCLNSKHPRKFFWSSVDRLANSFSEISLHIKKCSLVSYEVREKLEALKKDHPVHMARLPRGSQKIFLRRLWRRLHEDESAQKDDASVASSVTTDSSLVSGSVFVTSTGKMTMSVQEDKEWLTDADCFARKSIEIFLANENDRESYEKEKVVVEGQVGLRCIHCEGNNCKDKSALFYPTSIASIVDHIKDFQRNHLPTCESLPKADKSLFQKMSKKSVLNSVLKRHNLHTTGKLGLFENQNGVFAAKESVMNTRDIQFEQKKRKGSDDIFRQFVDIAIATSTVQSRTDQETNRTK